jgi:hypothetical protein
MRILSFDSSLPAEHRVHRPRHLALPLPLPLPSRSSWSNPISYLAADRFRAAELGKLD